MKPAILIAYGSDAITNGFKRVFGSEFKRVMCWAHMRRAVDKKIKMINDVSIENEVMEDIEKIQISQNPKTFEKASQLFLNKWQATKYKKMQNLVDFFSYFVQEWLGTHSGWYEGLELYKPSHNNALEAKQCNQRRRHFSRIASIAKVFSSS